MSAKAALLAALLLSAGIAPATAAEDDVPAGSDARVFLAHSAAQAASSARNGLRGLPSEWLRRLDFGWTAEQGGKPSYYAETVYPLYQDDRRIHTVFVEPRINYDADDEDYYNLGLGYRRYLTRWNALLGVNTFGDFQRADRHGRIGVGGEILSDRLDARVNGYFGVTPRRRVADEVYEKVVDGFDAEIGTPVPYLRGAKLFGGGYIYDYEAASNVYGWHGRLELTLLGCIVVNVGCSDDTHSKTEWSVDARVRLDWDTPRESLAGSARAYGVYDARDRALDRVERRHRLVKERTGGVTFSVAKA